MPNLPRLSLMSPVLQIGHITPVLFLAASASSLFMNLHFGYREQEIKVPVPSRLSRTTSLPPPDLPFFSPHSGHISPVSFGPFNSVPSSIKAPSQSGYFEQE